MFRLKFGYKTNGLRYRKSGIFFFVAILSICPPSLYLLPRKKGSVTWRPENGMRLSSSHAIAITFSNKCPNWSTMEWNFHLSMSVSNSLVGQPQP